MGRPRSFDRDAALDAAMRQFWERGYEATSIGDLTAAMGISPPSLYAAFGDKQQLFDEAARRYRDEPNSFVAEALAESRAHVAFSRLLHDAARVYTDRANPSGCMIITEPGLGELRQLARDDLRARIMAGQRAGELATDLDVDGLVDYFAAVLTGMSARARDGADAATLRAIAERAMLAWPA